MKKINNNSEDIIILIDKRNNEIVRLLFVTDNFARIKNGKGVEIVLSKKSLLMNYEEI